MPPLDAMIPSLKLGARHKPVKLPPVPLFAARLTGRFRRVRHIESFTSFLLVQKLTIADRQLTHHGLYTSQDRTDVSPKFTSALCRASVSSASRSLNCVPYTLRTEVTIAWSVSTCENYIIAEGLVISVIGSSVHCSLGMTGPTGESLRCARTARALRATFRLCSPRRAPKHTPWKRP